MNNILGMIAISFSSYGFNDHIKMELACKQYLYDKYREVQKFNQSNPHFISNHESGNWYTWRSKQKDKITEHKYIVGRLLECLNKGEYEDCERYWEKINKIK